jgi:hypothetical protein
VIAVDAPLDDERVGIRPLFAEAVVDDEPARGEIRHAPGMDLAVVVERVWAVSIPALSVP